MAVPENREETNWIARLWAQMIRGSKPSEQTETWFEVVNKNMLIRYAGQIQLKRGEPREIVYVEPQQQEEAIAPRMILGRRSREQEELQIQNDYLRSSATQERRLAARESTRCDELSERNRQLTENNRQLAKDIKELRKDYARMREEISELNELLRTRETTGRPHHDGTLREFYRLTAIWKTTTIHLSNITEKCSHPAYEQIIALGPDVLSLIFDELEREPDDWFVALRTLTGVNPVSLQSRANLDETIAAWLEWAKHNGYFHRSGAEEGLSESQLEYIRREEQEDTSV